MESRIRDFLKCCDVEQSCETYIEDHHDRVQKMVSDPAFLKQLKRYSALANKNRLLIYHLIQTEEYCNCTLAKVVGLSEGSITHHIKKLEDAGLIIGRSKGHFTVYQTTEDLKSDLSKE